MLVIPHFKNQLYQRTMPQGRYVVEENADSGYFYRGYHVYYVCPFDMGFTV